MLNPNDKILIENEIKGCFDYFWNETNTDINSKGFGLVRDITNKDIASIAAVGFALPAYMIGVEHHLVSFDEAYNRVLNTLKTVKINILVVRIILLNKSIHIVIH